MLTKNPITKKFDSFHNNCFLLNNVASFQVSSIAKNAFGFHTFVAIMIRILRLNFVLELSAINHKIRTVN